MSMGLLARNAERAAVALANVNVELGKTATANQGVGGQGAISFGRAGAPSTALLGRGGAPSTALLGTEAPVVLNAFGQVVEQNVAGGQLGTGSTEVADQSGVVTGAISSDRFFAALLTVLKEGFALIGNQGTEIGRTTIIYGGSASRNA